MPTMATWDAFSPAPIPSASHVAGGRVTTTKARQLTHELTGLRSVKGQSNRG